MFSFCIPRPRQVLPEISHYNSAGCLFTNGTHFLAAYQHDFERPTVSGIGGKREAGEKYMETAIRETVEELFGFKKVSPALIDRIISKMEPRSVKQTGPYVLVIYNFNDLEKMIEIVRREVTTSPLYKVFPRTLIDLVLKRELQADPRPEVFYLSLLPAVKNATINLDFLGDIEVILEDGLMVRNPMN